LIISKHYFLKKGLFKLLAGEIITRVSLTLVNEKKISLVAQKWWKGFREMPI